MKYEYICRNLNSLLGVPVSVYQGTDLIARYSSVEFALDPVAFLWRQIEGVGARVGQITLPNHFFLGVVHCESYFVVVGPTMPAPPTVDALRRLAFDLRLPSDGVDDFVRSMQGVMPLSLQALATACCLIDHDLNGGELYMQEALFDSTPAPTPAEEDAPLREVHNTMDIERTLVRYVREGDVDAILAWAKHAPHVNAGTTSAVYLRAERNILVVAATLMSRAAIEGGVPAQEALGLSDEYIRRSEATTSSGQLSYLQFRMVLDYAERVRRYRLSRASTLLSRRVVGYVLDHLEGPVKVEEIARELGVSRPYLSAQFARDTGKSLTDYILEQKVERARELLRSSEEPLSTVAERLGFSSQSHFCRVFKEQVGLTPARFRRGE